MIIETKFDIVEDYMDFQMFDSLEDIKEAMCKHGK
jgi:hypothetical protein